MFAADGQKWLDSTFNLCPNSTVTEATVQSMLDWLNGAWSYLAMIDYPYPTNFLNPVPGWPVKVACSHISMANPQPKVLLQGIMGAVSVYLNYTGQTGCYSFNNTASSSLGTDGWDFQACTEMVMPMCQTANSMFEVLAWDFNAYAERCMSVWNVTSRLDWAMTNYGGRHLQAASNIIFRLPSNLLSIFSAVAPPSNHLPSPSPLQRLHSLGSLSNGLLDPWSGGSPLRPLPSHGHDIAIFNISLGAHHLDLRASHPKVPHPHRLQALPKQCILIQDPNQLRLVRNKERHLFRAWLEEFYSPRRPSFRRNLRLSHNRAALPRSFPKLSIFSSPKGLDNLVEL